MARDLGPEKGGQAGEGLMLPESRHEARLWIRHPTQSFYRGNARKMSKLPGIFPRRDMPQAVVHNCQMPSKKEIGHFAPDSLSRAVDERSEPGRRHVGPRAVGSPRMHGRAVLS